MSSPIQRAQATPSADEHAVRELFTGLLESWNKRNSGAYAALFDENANLVGFDGSQMNSRSEVESSLRQIFTDHQTFAYVGKIREVRFLTPDIAMLSAVVGMIPPGKSDLDSAVNAIQSLVAVKRNREWRIALFQNTPAQFHGRPELQHVLTDELRQLL